MRTNVFDRTWEIRLRPINSLAGLFLVGNDTNANRVDSIIPDARIIEQFGLIGRNLDALLTDTWRPVTAPPAATRRVTWALGTTKSPRWLSGRPLDSRAASARSVALLYLSKLNSPDAGACPWTARGGSSTESRFATPDVEMTVFIFDFKRSNSGPWMKSVFTSTPVCCSSAG